MRAAASEARSEPAGVPLASLTTIGLGGPARRIVEARSDERVIAAAAEADRAGEPLLVIAGGSNLVIGDDGFAGTVLRIATAGIGVGEDAAGEQVRVRVAAGESWDGLVTRAVGAGLAGIECMAGIPGSCGATPIQNVGAYGQEVAETIASVRVYDRSAGEVLELSADECGFGYRSSRFKHSRRHIVLSVEYVLSRSGAAAPVRYPGLAAALGVELGAQPPLSEVRRAVVGLRRQKGMVVDPADPDSRSAGSFFVNPILSAAEFAALEARVAGRLGAGAPRPPAWPEPDGRVKTSAAWLIEQAGFRRGHGVGRAGISSKHTLALVNRGGASTAELLELAREIRDGVAAAFGLTLAPEPTLVGVAI